MRSILLIVLAAALSCSSAFAWGCEGHQIIALIARTHLTPAVSAAVDDLLRANPIDPALSRFCQDRPADLMADASTWADDAKNPEKTGVWHYVDIPLSVAGVTSLDPWCPPIGPSIGGKNRSGCLTKAIEYELAILRNKSNSPAERAAALRYIIHFVGDITEPLHDEDNSDQGGNCTVIRFFDEDRPTNLHAIWDYKLIERQLELKKLSQSSYAADLNMRFAAKYSELARLNPNDPDAWAWEGHALAQTVAYGNLQPQIPVETPNPQAVCAAEREKVQALHIAVSDAYMNKAMPVIDSLLATAGFRLALLVNNTLQ